MSVTMKIVKNVTRPVSDDRTRNLTNWLDDECKECRERRIVSTLKEKLEEVDWAKVAAQEKCTGVVSMKTE